MDNIQDAGRYKAMGYSFLTERDAALAENERRKVAYLEARLDYNNPESILRIYRKAVEDRLFKSPVGIFFLKHLQSYLLEQSDIDSGAVDAIPLYVSFEGEFREQGNPARNRVKPAEPKQSPKKSIALPVSIIMNICLAAAVIAMFAITLNAEQPNILNYEKVITNRYAAWEQELTERENAVRERELNQNTK
ncbi:MAG: hypothetical protein NC092_08575 [Butyrivibrio sp.]|nr:hypothetical protein [Muribaculum sp.]MCM1552730.1 hypothetical protein [Butyrivibrio sp.]